MTFYSFFYPDIRLVITILKPSLFISTICTKKRLRASSTTPALNLITYTQTIIGPYCLVVSFSSSLLSSWSDFFLKRNKTPKDSKDNTPN